MSTTRVDQTRMAILRALHDMSGPVGATRLMERLASMGHTVQPRTIRFHLLQLDREGLTRFVSRRLGREITDRGREEMTRANVVEKVGFVAAKVDNLGYRMSFESRRGKGSIIANLAFVDHRVLRLALKEIEPAFAAGLGFGTRLAVAGAGQRIADLSVPEGQVALATVCSLTVNGLLLKEGIPVVSRFGGLLEVRDRRPVRFVELIEYAGTTLDPLETFVRAGMTRVRECARTGEGIIGASFREIPAVALPEVTRLQRQLESQGLWGIMAVGRPNRPLFEIPVADGRAGLIVVGGLNPLAAVFESGIRIGMLSMSGIEDIERFGPFKTVCRQTEEQTWVRASESA